MIYHVSEIKFRALCIDVNCHIDVINYWIMFNDKGQAIDKIQKYWKERKSSDDEMFSYEMLELAAEYGKDLTEFVKQTELPPCWLAELLLTELHAVLRHLVTSGFYAFPAGKGTDEITYLPDWFCDAIVPETECSEKYIDKFEAVIDNAGISREPHDTKDCAVCRMLDENY